MNEVGPKDIAVIGMSFRLPGGGRPDAFWKALLSERDCIGKAPRERKGLFNAKDVQAGELRLGLIEDADTFDAAFFNMAPKEAAATDPRQRLFLEAAFTAADTAGYGGERLWGSNTGVFVGASGRAFSDSGHSSEDGTRHAEAMIANRVSHFMNLRGPSEVVDTLCSSTLAAIHEACLYLRNDERCLAIAGGVHIITDTSQAVFLSKMNLLSPSGRCKTFDAGADGFVPGEGVGAFLLKPLDAALEDGDYIWGVIKGSSVNHNGRTDSIMMPDARAVSDLVEAAWNDAGVDPETISFIEVNGSGTPLGDAVEFRGLKKAFAKHTRRKGFCGLGAVKTRIGNLEAASGVGALVKILFSMKHGIVPSNLHFEKINPLIKIEDSPFFLCNGTTEWPEGRSWRRAGINALGIGGANCHLIIEAPDFKRKIRKKTQPVGPDLLCLSAKTKTALKVMCGRYANRIETETGVDIRDFCAANNTGRSHYKWGLSIVAKNRFELVQTLRAVSDSPEQQWSGLKNVFYRGKTAFAMPSRKGGALSNLLGHMKGSAGALDDRIRRPGRVIFLVGDADTAEDLEARYRDAEALMDAGIAPDRVLGQGKGTRIARALAADGRDAETVRRVLEDAGGEEDPDVFFSAVEKRSAESRFFFVGLGLSRRDEEFVEGMLQGRFFTKWPREGGDQDALIRMVAELHAFGVHLDFDKFYAKTPFQRTPLPPYPYEKTAFSIGEGPVSETGSGNRFDFLDAILNGIRPDSDIDETEGRITEVLAQTLIRIFGYSPTDIEADRDFRDYGINSIVTVQLIHILETRLGMEIGPFEFGRYPTIQSLAWHLADRYKTSRRRDEGAKDGDVTLVEAGREHVECVLGWLNDPLINRWLDPFFQRGFSAKSYGFFLAKRDKKTFIVYYRSQPVGICGLVDLDLQNLSAESWLVIGDPRALAEGAAVQSGKALFEKAFGEFGLETLTGKVRSDNEPALAVMRYTGWRKVGVLRNSLKVEDRFYDRYLFQMTRSEFEAVNKKRTRNGR